MTDQAELLNDAEETMRLVLDGRQSSMWCAIPCIVQSFDSLTMTCEAQPTIQGVVTDSKGNTSFVNLPLLVDVPVIFPSAGGFVITMPIQLGDEVLVIFASRAIDAWWQSGGIQVPVEARMHDLSDGFAIAGPKSLPNVVPSISSTKLQIRNKAGTVYLSVGTKFAMTNAATSLYTILNGLTLALSTFSTGLNTGNLATNATALAASLATIITEITALLEV